MDDGIEPEHRRALGGLAAIAAVCLLVTAVFAVAFAANSRALVDGYRASAGSAGMPGEAVVTAIEDRRDGQVCLGLFTPENGGAAVEARIEVRGECEADQRIDARLASAHTSPFIGDEHPRAWEPGAGDWGMFVPFTVLFALACAVPGLIAAAALSRCAVLAFGRPRPRT
ncbi:hypothetical protein [Glycomyces sp. MUSA5-2]|uniref:hypothetical protein n=1 Tax=Glycomyces sp. MUSA5-2 TaxID=2053002 RepID=UPI00300BD4F5